MTHDSKDAFAFEASGLSHVNLNMIGVASSSTPLPSRRRSARTPLDPVRRAHIEQIDARQPISSFSPRHSTPLRFNATQEHAQSSVFISPNNLSRKRSHHTAVASSSSPQTFASGYASKSVSMYAPSASRSHGHEAAAVSQMDAPDLDSDASWYLGNQDSPSTSRFSTDSVAQGSWSRRQHHTFHTRYSEPQTCHPARPPQGEFSFQAPSTARSHAAYRQSVHEGTSAEMIESSSSAFARLAKAQRQQQEARRMAASGAAPPLSDDHFEGPAAKKRRSVAGTLIDGALNAALYTGAAAFTAYSLWSNWGRKDRYETETESDDVTRNGTTKGAEQMPPGALEEPPPPYVEQSSSAATASVTRPANATNSPANRPVHVFVSSRRRRPVFATHRSLLGTPKRRSAIPDFMSDASTTSTPSLVAARASDQDRTMSSFSTDTHNTTIDNEEDDEDLDGEDDDDEMFKRFQAKMSSLIEEGTKALNSTVELSAMDLEETEEHVRSATGILSPSISVPAQLTGRPFPRAGRDPYKTPPMRTVELPQSQSIAGLESVGSQRSVITPRTSSIPLPVNGHTHSPRATYLTLAGRDVNSPYGRLARRQTPSSKANVIATPTYTET